MKAFVILLCACAIVLGQAPSTPTNLRLSSASTTPADPAIIPVPVLATNGGFQAWYIWPAGTTNLWMPESSANGTDWMWSPEWAQLSPRALRQSGMKLNLPRMAEVAGIGWQVRLRRVTLSPLFPNPPIPY